MHEEKTMVALLRFNYDPNIPIQNTPIFGPRFDSQDTWILHSNMNIPDKYMKAFGFEMGKLACDNKLIYLFLTLGYTVINDPLLIKTYHYQMSAARTYTIKDRVPEPWGCIMPARISPEYMLESLNLTLQSTLKMNSSFDCFNDNTKLYNYILGKFANNTPFIIPRIAGVENNVAIMMKLMQESNPTQQQHQMQYLNKVIPTMKNNAGIKLSNINSVEKYMKLYLDAFENSDMISVWDTWGDVYKYISSSHDYITETYNTCDQIWAFSFDIFHYIHNTPWTHALKGKRILLVCGFEESIKDQLEKREKIYGVDLFPDCEFVCIKPPQTQGTNDSAEFDVELNRFVEKLKGPEYAGKYDIALCAAGGYGNLICNEIYKMGKPAIYVGGVLQMYFGILGQRWVRERPDILRMYLNEHWTRPKTTEKPKNFDKVEGSCYW